MKSIFITLTTGRSGTGKLTSILSQVSGMVAQHEAEPCYSTAKDKFEFVKSKLEYIDGLNCKYYCDTSFVIGEGFIEHFLSLGVTPHFIHLYRNPRLVASSMFRLGVIPSRDPYFVFPNNFHELHDYQLCYWHCLEMDRLTKPYQPLAYYIETEQLNDLNKVNAMLTHFDLPTLSSVSTEIVNAKTEYKRRILPDNLTQLEEEVRIGIASAEDSNHPKK